MLLVPARRTWEKRVTERETPKRPFPALCRRAERLLNTPSDQFGRVGAEDVKALVHELDVHQTELELQNEELRRAQVELEDARDRLSELYDLAPVGYLAIDAHGVIHQANLAACDMLCVERGRLVNANVCKFVDRDDQDTWYRHRQQVFATDKRQSDDLRFRRENGHIIHAHVQSRLLAGQEGQADTCLTALVDVTEKTAAKEAVRASEARLVENERKYRTLFESSMDALFLVNGHGTIVDANPAGQTLYYCTKEELIGRSAREFVHPSCHDDFSRSHESIKEGGYIEIEGTDVRADGTPFPVEVRIAPLHLDDGPALLVALRDITERKRLENGLRDARDRLEQRVAERTAELAAANASLRREIQKRERVERQLRAERDLASALSSAARLDEGLRACMSAAMQAPGVDGAGIYVVEPASGDLALACHEGFSAEFIAKVRSFPADSANTRLVMEGKALLGSGQIVELPATAEPIRGEGLRWVGVLPLLHEGKVVACLNVASRLVNQLPQVSCDALVSIAVQSASAIARLTAEQAVRANEAMFRGLADRSFDLIFMADASGKITYVSPASRRILGAAPEDIVGCHFSEFHPESEARVARQAHQKLIDGRDVGTFQLKVLRRDGRRAVVELNATRVIEGNRVTGTQGVIRDITQRKRVESLETQLMHTSRLATMGEMAAGIAHELNQPLAAIAVWAEVASRWFREGGKEDPAEAVGSLDRLGDEIQRVGRVISRMKELAMRSELRKSTVAMVKLIEAVRPLIDHDLRNTGVQFKLDIDADLPLVHADGIQMQQVLLNLVRNAIEAMADVEPGARHLTVAAEAGNGAVKVAVSDTGCGLPAGDSARVFDAYYTTKPHGVGLGLAICRTIVEAHGGRILAKRNARGGATFTFAIPTTRK